MVAMPYVNSVVRLHKKTINQNRIFAEEYQLYYSQSTARWLGFKLGAKHRSSAILWTSFLGIELLGKMFYDSTVLLPGNKSADFVTWIRTLQWSPDPCGLPWWFLAKGKCRNRLCSLQYPIIPFLGRCIEGDCRICETVKNHWVSLPRTKKGRWHHQRPFCLLWVSYVLLIAPSFSSVPISSRIASDSPQVLSNIPGATRSWYKATNWSP